MNPLYLGTRERRLFAIYEPPVVRPPRARAAVLCYPWGSEYVYAHRSMRALATKLSQAGYHTLRFDFFGTGDSSGELIEADLSGWEDDTVSAVEGINDIAGTNHVTLIGMRIGGSVAAAAAAHRPDEIDALVLWDPVVCGKEYLHSLGVPLPACDEQTVTEVQGFAVSARLLREFESIDLHRHLAAAPKRSLVLVTEPLASHRHFESAPPADHARPPADGPRPAPGAQRATFEFVASPCPWREENSVSGATPAKAIQKIVEWLA